MLSKEEIEKAKERLVKQAVTNNVDCEDYPNCICMKKDLIIVLNYIEQLEQENNITDVTLQNIRQDGIMQGMVEEHNKLKKYIDKLNKMIDEMAKWIYEKDYNSQEIMLICERNEDYYSNNIVRVKKYFEEKVEDK